MDATTFQFQLLVPPDAEVASLVRMLAEQAARYAGCSESGTAAFGERVGEVVRARLTGAATHAAIPVVVRRSTGPLEVQVDTRTVALEI